MAHDNDHGFSANKILVALIVLTALEVGWSFIDFPKWALWGGLLVFAIWKGFLIFTYFMHMKFEGWIVKGFLLPTIPLMLIVVFAVMPDVSFNTQAKHPIGSMVDPQTGEVVHSMNEGRAGRVSEKKVAAPAAGR